MRCLLVLVLLTQSTFITNKKNTRKILTDAFRVPFQQVWSTVTVLGTGIHEEREMFSLSHPCELNHRQEIKVCETQGRKKKEGGVNRKQRKGAGGGSHNPFLFPTLFLVVKSTEPLDAGFTSAASATLALAFLFTHNAKNICHVFF